MIAYLVGGPDGMTLAPMLLRATPTEPLSRSHRRAKCRGIPCESLTPTYSFRNPAGVGQIAAAMDASACHPEQYSLVILSVSEGSHAWRQRDPSLTLRMTRQADALLPNAD